MKERKKHGDSNAERDREILYRQRNRTKDRKRHGGSNAEGDREILTHIIILTLESLPYLDPDLPS